MVDWIINGSKIEGKLGGDDYHLILIDLMFDDRPRGSEILERIKKRLSSPPVIILTNSSETHHAVKAIKQGALS